MKVKILGSVSPYPKNTYNCPGYMIENEDIKILLDCGSGITRLMNMPKDLKNLTIIISHLHKDHYSDIASISYASLVYHNLGLLKEEERIKLYIPNDISSEDFQYLNSFGKDDYLDITVYNENSLLNIGDMKLSFLRTKHGIVTYAVNVENEDFKISYSGDTGFILNDLKYFFKKADLLICESTFLKNQKGNNDFHLSSYEAGIIARESEIGKLVLTHFWPEENKNLYKQEAQENFMNIEVAEEGKVYILKK